MTRLRWARRITASCKEAGTYRPYFDDVIDTLADILARRDAAKELFKKSGGNVMVVHVNKSGAANMEQNPALRLVNDLDRDALSYWRDLGLTPAGLKRINEGAMAAQEEADPLAAALSQIRVVGAM